MSFRDDDRAQSVQIGAVLLFATLIIALSLYQATVVPSQNQSIEYAAYEDATGDVTELRNAMLSAAAGDGTRGVTVKTGAQYPSRVFLMNPLPPSGDLTTTDPANVTIGNVSASPGEFLNAGAYLSTEGNALSYATRRVRFDPDYNVLSAAPIVTTNGLVYREHRQPTPLASQMLVRGNTITLQTVVGDLGASGYTSPITVIPVSAHTNTVTVTNTSSQQLTLTVPTQLNASQWESQVLRGETGRYVADVRAGPRPDTVTVAMEAGQQYELRVARIELAERNTGPSVQDPPARYLVTHTDRQVRTNSDGRVRLVVEARDALNNPVSNQPVTFSSPSGKFETQSGDDLGASPTVDSNENGNAVVYYNATDYVGNLQVTARLGTGSSVPAEKRVQYQVTNTVTSTGGDGTSGEQAGRTLVVLEDSGTIPNSDTFTFSIRNRGVNPVNLTGYRLDYITKMASNGQVSDGPNEIVSVSFPGLGESRTGTASEGREPLFLSDPVQIPANETVDMEVTFEQSWNLGNKDALVISTGFYFEGGIVSTYTVFHINN